MGSIDSEDMVQSAVNKGFGIGSGAFGMKTYYGTWEKNIAAKYRYIVPIIAEWRLGQGFSRRCPYALGIREI